MVGLCQSETTHQLATCSHEEYTVFSAEDVKRTSHTYDWLHTRYINSVIYVVVLSEPDES